MKNTIKKISAFLLSLVLLLGIVPLADLDIIASAATYSGTCGDNLTWTFDSMTSELVISGSGEMDNWTSSSSAPWYDNRSYIKTVTIADGVTSIGDQAFRSCYNLTNIKIPNSVTRIGKTAFYSCSSLTSIGIPDGVTSIGDSAFLWCEGLKSIKIPNSVTSLGSGVFHNCTGLNNVTIGNGITDIGEKTFYNCSNLTSVTIGNSLTSIGKNAFYDCAKLTDVYYTGDIAGWCGVSIADFYSNPMYYGANLYIDGTLVKGDLVIPDNATHIGERAFAYCNSLTSVTVPDSVTDIGDSAFYSCSNLASVIVGDGVTRIGEEVFWCCESLTKVTIGCNVKLIDNYVFYECNSLENVYYTGDIAGWCEIWFYNELSNPIYYAENLYINGTYIRSVAIPDGVTSIGNYVFYNYDKLTSVEIPASVTSIGYLALFDCDKLESITVDKNNKAFLSDEYGVLYNKDKTELIQYPILNKTKNYVIPDSVTSIRKYALRSSYIESVVIGEGITKIGDHEFYDCYGLSNVTIPNSVTSIGGGAFQYCNSLTSITLGNGIKDIGYVAFDGCSNLDDVYYNGTEKQWNKINISTGNGALLHATIHFMHEHSYTAVVTPPTCQTQGYTTYTCEECGDSYVDDYTDTVDHYYLDGKCIWCGDTNITPSSIIDITYTPSDSARKLFTVTCADRAQMIQFIEPDGGTRTYYRNNANVTITSYNADGEVVGDLSRDLAYEVWEIYSNMSIGTTIKVRAKFNSRWELDKRSLVVYEYNPVISMELSRTSGKKGPVPATVVADEKTENVKFKMPNGTSVTVTQFTTDENGNRVFKGNAWANEDGLNVITVTIRRKNVTKTVGTLEYTVE